MKLDRALTYRAIHEGGQIGSSDSLDWNSPTIHELDIEDGDEIVLIPRLTGGKPVIYLFPPSGAEIDASVKLSLVLEWHFSAIYPVVLIVSESSESGSRGQNLQWDVKASSDGMLLEMNTRLDVAYLFWEAEYVLYYSFMKSILINFTQDICPPFERSFLAHPFRSRGTIFTSCAQWPVG